MYYFLAKVLQININIIIIKKNICIALVKLWNSFNKPAVLYSRKTESSISTHCHLPELSCIASMFKYFHSNKTNLFNKWDSSAIPHNFITSMVLKKILLAFQPPGILINCTDLLQHAIIINNWSRSWSGFCEKG